MRDHERFIEQVRGWAQGRQDVGAVLVVGSAARSVVPADTWSDVDIALFVDDPAAYLQDAAWLHAFGTPLLTFIESTAVGDSLERRVLFEDGLEADFALFPVAAAGRLRADAGADEALRRGYRVLVDRVGLGPILEQSSPTTPAADAPALTQLASDVWYHALWAAKKLRRGEVWVARSCVDGYLHARLVELVAIRARARWIRRWTPGMEAGSSSGGPQSTSSTRCGSRLVETGTTWPALSDVASICSTSSPTQRLPGSAPRSMSDVTVPARCSKHCSHLQSRAGGRPDPPDHAAWRAATLARI